MRFAEIRENSGVPMDGSKGIQLFLIPPGNYTIPRFDLSSISIIIMNFSHTLFAELAIKKWFSNIHVNRESVLELIIGL